MPNVRPRHASFLVEATVRALLFCSVLPALSGCGGTAGGSTTQQSGATLTTTSLTADVAGVAAVTVPVNTAVVLTATVTPVSGSGVTGSVSFYDGATLLGVGSQSASAGATLNVSFTTTGTHSLTAAYAGNLQFAASTSTVLPLAVTAASSTSPTGASTVYVVNGTPGYNVLQFSATATGSVSPTATLNLPLGSNFIVGSIATDSTGQIYIGATGGTVPEILVYAPGASGTATPLRTIVETTTTCAPSSMVVDASGTIYTVDDNNNCVAVYPPGANGTVAPARTIAGTLTQLFDALYITVDTTGDIYVSAASSTAGTALILEFASGASGNVAPTRVITGPVPTAGSIQLFSGLALDSSGNLYAAEISTNSSLTSITGAIVEFAPGASGSATPSRTISGTLTGIGEAGTLRIDSAGNLYLANYTITNYTTFAGTPSILVFGPTASGNIAPSLNITSSSWSGGQSAIAIH